MKRLIIGISGASGAIYGVRLLQVLRDVTDVETHLVMSAAARQTLALETDLCTRRAGSGECDSRYARYRRQYIVWLFSDRRDGYPALFN